MESAELTKKVAAMTEEERVARRDELVHTPGELNRDELLEFTKILFGAGTWLLDPESDLSGLDQR